jgi:hypothetical protein
MGGRRDDGTMDGAVMGGVSSSVPAAFTSATLEGGSGGITATLCKAAMMVACGKHCK